MRVWLQVVSSALLTSSTRNSNIGCLRHGRFNDDGHWAFICRCSTSGDRCPDSAGSRPNGQRPNISSQDGRHPSVELGGRPTKRAISMSDHSHFAPVSMLTRGGDRRPFSRGKRGAAQQEEEAGGGWGNGAIHASIRFAGHVRHVPTSTYMRASEVREASIAAKVHPSCCQPGLCACSLATWLAGRDRQSQTIFARIC